MHGVIRRQYRTALSALSVVPGGALTLLGAGLDGWHAPDIRSIGLALTVATVVVLAVRAMGRPSRAAYELGRADGYREGYNDGRHVAKPVVVPCRAEGA